MLTKNLENAVKLDIIDYNELFSINKSLTLNICHSNKTLNMDSNIVIIIITHKVKFYINTKG